MIEDKVYSQEELLKLANSILNDNTEEEINDPIIFNEEVFNLPTIKVSLIKHIDGTLVEDNGNYIELSPRFYESIYTKGLYVECDKVVSDYNGRVILLKDSILVYSNLSDIINQYGYYYYRNSISFSIRELEYKGVIYNVKYVPDNYKIDKDNVYREIVLKPVEELSYYNLLKETLDLFYPDQWDFKKYTDYNFIHNNSSHISHYLLLLKFKDITITNSTNRSHLIDEIYTGFLFNNNGLEYGVLGIRPSHSNVEIAANYSHSHLSGIKNKSLDGFCLGSGEINIAISNCKAKLTEMNLKTLWVMLKPFLEWESLEGTPYRNMRNICSKTYVTDTNAVGYSLNSITSCIKNNLNDISIKIGESGFFEASYEDLEKLLTLRDDLPKVYYDSDTNKYFNPQNITNVTNFRPEKVFSFKGEDIYTKVYNKETIKENLIQIVHPYVTRAAQTILSKRINEYYFSKITD